MPFEPLPMIRHPAILPRVGQLLDHIHQLLAQLGRTEIIGSPLAAITKLGTTYLPSIGHIVHYMWAAAAAAAKGAFYRVVPGNLFWPALVPAQIEATINIIRSGQDCTGAQLPVVVDCSVWVPTGWALLWRKGAFGKGILSRADPTWLLRFNRARLAPESAHRGSKYLEDITRQRRTERHAAKESEPAHPSKDKDGVTGLTLVPMSEFEVSTDEAQEMEPLQLSFYETLFLCDLGCLRVRDSAGVEYGYFDLWHLFCTVDRSPDFALKFAAYYYYRSKGWVVKSGLKFGTDFMLYKKGPAQSHAQYSVLVRRNDDCADADCAANDDEPWAASESWQYMFSLSRVTTQVRKTLILCYVESPPPLTSTESAQEPEAGSMPPEMNQYRIREFVVQRFNPNRK
ncbi:tRNA splicing endonuclease subunit sen2 [Coemansia thaxteri]|nr:tRNA splicing endonuclease subunit sen2 [Coemansia thaxteri]